MKHKYIENVTTLELDANKCTGCGKCAEVCPHRILYVEDGRAKIIHKDYCIECGACMKNCPFYAIKVETGTGCAYAVIRSLFIRKKQSCHSAGKDSNM